MTILMSKVNVQTLGRRVLVKPDAVEETTAGGLIIPPSAQDDKTPEIGEVVVLGTGEKGFEFTVKVGDRVSFRQYSPDKLEIDGELYYILSEDDVLAIIK